MTWNWFRHYQERVFDSRLADLSTLAQALYPLLLAHANEDLLEARPSRLRLSKLLGRSPRHIGRAVGELVDVGLLIVHQSGAGQACRYRFPGAVTARTAGSSDPGRVDAYVQANGSMDTGVQADGVDTGVQADGRVDIYVQADDSDDAPQHGQGGHGRPGCPPGRVDICVQAEAHDAPSQDTRAVRVDTGVHRTLFEPEQQPPPTPPTGPAESETEVDPGTVGAGGLSALGQQLRDIPLRNGVEAVASRIMAAAIDAAADGWVVPPDPDDVARVTVERLVAKYRPGSNDVGAVFRARYADDLKPVMRAAAEALATDARRRQGAEEIQQSAETRAQTKPKDPDQTKAEIDAILADPETPVWLRHTLRPEWREEESS